MVLPVQYLSGTVANVNVSIWGEQQAFVLYASDYVWREQQLFSVHVIIDVSGT